MGTWSRRGVLAGGAMAGVGVLVGARTAPRPDVLDIVTGEHSFSAPRHAPAGPVGFRVRTTSTRTGIAGLARLRPGATEDRFRALARKVFATQGAEAIQAGRELMATAELFGGAMVHLGVTSTFTARLEPGRYLLFEYLDFEGERGRNPPPGLEHVRTLRVTGRPTEDTKGGHPHPYAALTALDVPGEGPRFALRGRLPRGGTLKYTNRMRGQVNEAVLYPIEDDSVTTDDIQAFFDGAPGPPPFNMTGVLGTPPLSPGESVTLRMPLKRGRYALVTWVTSMQDARPLSAHDQLLIVTVP